MAAVWYATLEQCKAALDSKETARNNGQLSRLLDGCTDSIERDQLLRRFYPEVTTREFDWPTHADPRDGSRVLSLREDEMASVDEVTVEDVVIDPAHYKLLRAGGIPVVGIELDATVAISGTGRRAVEVGGAVGFWDRAAAAGVLAATIADDTAMSVTVSDSAAIGTGQLIAVGSERMIVDRRSMVDTGQTLGADLASANNAELVQVQSGVEYAEGEVVLVDAEKMLIVEIAGDQLIVKRSWDGSALAAHTTGAGIFAPRKLTVRRGVLGTTAAQHNSGLAVVRHMVPGLVNQLCIAETLAAFLGENSGLGKTVGSGEAKRDEPGSGLADLRERAWQAYGRKAW